MQRQNNIINKPNANPQLTFTVSQCVVSTPFNSYSLALLLPLPNTCHHLRLPFPPLTLLFLSSRMHFLLYSLKTFKMLHNTFSCKKKKKEWMDR